MRRLLIIALALASTAGAQSTASVGHDERTLQGDVWYAQKNDGDRSYCCEGGTIRTASLGIRWDPTGIGSFRFGVMGMDRTNTFSSPYVTPPETVSVHDRFLAITLSTEASLRLWQDVTVSLSALGGFVPYMHGTLRGNTRSYYGTRSGATRVGGIAGFSTSLRYRWFFVEQHALTLLGGDNAILDNREQFPLAFGIRF